MADTTPDQGLSDQTYLLRGALSKHRRRQTYGLTMMRESAVLAAFQTVDVRLSLLEHKGEEKATLSGLVWEAAVAACFGVAGSLVEKGLTAVFNSILKTRLAFSLVPKTELGAWVKEHQDREWERRIGKYERLLKDRYKISKNPAETATMWDDYRALLRDERREIKLFQRGFLDQNDVHLLYHELTFKAVDPLIKAAADVSAVQASLAKLLLADPSSPLNVADTPTVRVLRSALEFFDRQLETQQLVLDEFDLALACGRYSAEEVEKLASILVPGADAPFESIALNLDVWIRFFEFCIWVTLYPDIGTKPGKVENVPEALTAYLLHRVFVDGKADPELGRPLTVLENAVLASNPAAGAVAWLHRKLGSSGVSDALDAEKAAAFANPRALADLATAWRDLSANMEKATRKLYASSGPAAPP